MKPEVVEMLKVLRQISSHNPDDYVFTAVSNRSGKERKGKTSLCLTRYFQHWIEPAAKQLAIKVWRFGWHSFRRTYITWLAAANDNPKQVMELARHASIKVTMDVYAELQKDESREAHAKGLKYYSQPSLCVATHGFPARPRMIESWKQMASQQIS